MLGNMGDVNTGEYPNGRDAGSAPSGSSEPSRRPGRPAVRRRLLDAALTVFAERGFANATLDEVAAAAGLTKGAIYSNFDGKDEIFLAMLDEQVLNRVEAVRSALVAEPMPADARGAARHVGRLLAAAITEHRDWQLVFLDFWLRAVRDEEVHVQFLAHRRMLHAAISGAVTLAVGERPSATDFSTGDIVTVVLALSNGLAVEQYIDPEFVSEGLFERVLAQLAT